MAGDEKGGAGEAGGGGEWRVRGMTVPIGRGHGKSCWRRQSNGSGADARPNAKRRSAVAGGAAT